MKAASWKEGFNLGFFFQMKEKQVKNVYFHHMHS